MDDELYIEKFSSQENVVQSTVIVQNSPIIENVPLDIHEFNSQMLIYLDQLENEIKAEYSDFTDFSFLFNKIKNALKEQKLDVLQPLLSSLENLLDVEIF